MLKLTTLTVAAGLVMALTTVGSQAAIVGRGHQPVTHETHDCADTMGYMRTVHRADIDSIENYQRVVLIPVCQDSLLMERDSYGPLFVNGNVDTLRRPIAHNDTLISALRDQDMDQNDVVSLRFGADDSIILYVYDRDMR